MLIRSASLLVGVVLLSSCTGHAPAKTVVLPTPAACAHLTADTATSAPVQHDRQAVLSALHLAAGTTVHSVTNVHAANPIADKVGLPTTPRVWWLVLTDTSAEAGSHTGRPGPAVVATGQQHYLYVVDDATLRQAETYVC